MKAEIAALRQSSDLYALPLASAEGFAPPATAFVRKIVRRLLLPWISRQSSYNATTGRVLDSLRDQIELLAYHQALSTEELLDAQSRLVDAVCTRLDEVVPPASRDAAESLRVDVASLRDGLAALRADLAELKDALGLVASQLAALREEGPALRAGEGGDRGSEAPRGSSARGR